MSRSNLTPEEIARLAGAYFGHRVDQIIGAGLQMRLADAGMLPAGEDDEGDEDDETPQVTVHQQRPAALPQPAPQSNGSLPPAKRKRGRPPKNPPGIAGPQQPEYPQLPGPVPPEGGQQQ